jgi:hypothetical protein
LSPQKKTELKKASEKSGSSYGEKFVSQTNKSLRAADSPKWCIHPTLCPKAWQPLSQALIFL